MKKDLLSFYQAIPDAVMNQDSFEMLYSDYFIPIYKYVYYRIRDKEIAMDLVQTVFLKAFIKREFIRKEDALKYLYTIARNQLIDYLRKKHPLSLDTFESFFLERIPDESIENPEIQMSHIDEKNFIQKMLTSLSESQREIITLRYLQELDYSEIAEITGKSEVSVRKTVSRALKILQDYYYHIFIYEN